MLRRPLPYLAAFFVAAIVSHSPALAHQDFVPTAVQLAGWPIDSSGGSGPIPEVVNLEGLRFCDALETDFLVLLDTGQLFLGYRPGRYETFFELGENVAAFASVPHTDGKRAALVVDDSGLLVRAWAPTPTSVYADTVPLSTWIGVTRMWTYESSQGVMVYGHHPASERMRRALVVGSSAQPLTDLLVPAGLVDFAPLDYDVGTSGVELAWLYDETLSVTSEDQIQMILNVPATPGDTIARVPSIDQGEDLLAWCSVWEGERTFAAWSEHSSGVPYTVEGGTPTSIVVYDRNDDGVADIALPLLESPHVELLEHLAWGIFAPPDGKRWLDTEQPGGESFPVSRACAADVDQDGDLDFLVGHAGHDSLQFQLSDVRNEEAQRLRLDLRDEISRSFDQEGTVTLHLPLSVNTPTSESYDVMVWLEDVDGGPDSMAQPSFRRTLSFSSNLPNPLPFDLTLSEEGADNGETDVIYWIFIAAVDVTGDQESEDIVHRFPTRLISWRPSTGSSPEGASPLPKWKYLVDVGGDDLTGTRRGNKIRNNGSGGPPP